MTNSKLQFTAEEMAILGGRIKSARTKAKLTQRQVAEILDCSEGHLSAVENGKTMLSGRELVVFCKLYNRGLSYYFDGLLGIDDPTSGGGSERNTLEQCGYMSAETLQWMQRFINNLEKDLDDVRKKNNGKPVRSRFRSQKAK